MTSDVQIEPIRYPFGSAEGVDLDPAYTEARDAPGMIRIKLLYGEPAWLATRYDDVRMVFGDRRFSRAMAADADVPRMTPHKLDGGIVMMDPPEHSRLRKLVAQAFTQNRVQRLRGRVRQLAEDLVDAMAAGGAPADLVENFSLPLPVSVICELLGVPMADWPKFRVWSDGILSTSETTAEEYEANEAELQEYMRGLIAARRAEPADDLMTALVEARHEHDRLSEAELIDLCDGLLVAGHETSASLIASSVFVLLERPERLAELRADLSLLPAAAEELLRFVPLSHWEGFPRYATEDVEVGGSLVRAGEPVVTDFASANRDPRRFENPDVLRFDRKANSHLAFGHGVHHCLGANLARVELQEGLRALLTKLPGLRIAGEIEWKVDMPVRGPRRMPIGW
ncbi:cytochrome P450 [Amycolatopsis sp. VC5-11]|uniref:cytochrome P450 n=1 Tax=Amycolatopsis sp. VC5-11 TaxID=3120156 RepID=UPI00300AF9B8